VAKINFTGLCEFNLIKTVGLRFSFPFPGIKSQQEQFLLKKLYKLKNCGFLAAGTGKNKAKQTPTALV